MSALNIGAASKHALNEMMFLTLQCLSPVPHTYFSIKRNLPDPGNQYLYLSEK